VFWSAGSEWGSEDTWGCDDEFVVDGQLGSSPKHDPSLATWTVSRLLPEKWLLVLSTFALCALVEPAQKSPRNHITDAE
jgi:hypothetical protein